MDFPLWFKRFVFLRYRNYITKKHRLDYLFWECTLRCNLNCLHCGSDCTKESGTKDMPLEDFVKVLDDIKTHGDQKNLTVCITGGEPLLRKDLEDAGIEIIKRGFKWGIVTNGLVFTPQRFKSLVQSGMTSMSFSLDGFEEQHTYLRQNPLSYQKVVDAIQTVVNFQKLNPGYFVFDVITCVHKKNISILPELRDFLIGMGVRQWRIFSIFPEGRAQQNDFALSTEEYKNLMEFISDTRNYKNPEGKSIHLNYSCEGYLGKYELKARDYFFFCRGGITIASVWANGNVSACLSVRAPDLIQGNIYKENFTDIWNKKFLPMRNRTWAKNHGCKNCKQWKYCLGNGLHLHNNLTDEVSRCNYGLLNK